MPPAEDRDPPSQSPAFKPQPQAVSGGFANLIWMLPAACAEPQVRDQNGIQVYGRHAARGQQWSICRWGRDASCTRCRLCRCNIPCGTTPCVGGLPTCSGGQITKAGHWSTPGAEPLNLNRTRHTNKQCMDGVNHSGLHRKWSVDKACGYVCSSVLSKFKPCDLFGVKSCHKSLQCVGLGDAHPSPRETTGLGGKGGGLQHPLDFSKIDGKQLDPLLSYHHITEIWHHQNTHGMLAGECWNV